MSIDPSDLPLGTVVEIGKHAYVIREHGKPSSYFEAGMPFTSDGAITRVFVPVPQPMTYADAEAALADAGAWVLLDPDEDNPKGARIRMEWTHPTGDARRYVHRDDLPPTDPDAELVEKMARAGHAAVESPLVWGDRSESFQDEYRSVARAALAVVREHEAKS